MNDEPIVIEIPSELKTLVPAIKKLVMTVERKQRHWARNGAVVDYAEVERTLADLTSDLQRRAHGVVLRALDPRAKRVRIRGRLFHSVGLFAVQMMTLAGPVTVERTLYREAGLRNGETVDPLALRGGFVEGIWLPETAKAMAFLVQQAPSREAQRAAEQLRRLPYSRCSFERIAHAVGERYIVERIDVEEELIGRYVLPENAASLSVSLDRVSVPMEEPRPKPAGRPAKGAPKRPISRVYRMAYCGTVTIHDATGKALHTIRYGRMPGSASGAVSLCEGLVSDVEALLAQRPDLKVVLLADGGAEMWTLLDDHLNEASIGITVFRLLDFWHVVEKMAAAARVIFADEAERALTLRRWRSRLRNRSSAAFDILAELNASGLEHKWVGDKQPVHEAITYLDNNSDRMNYRRARQHGLPIGSGNVEATCKTLVEVRMKRPGSRWKIDTGDHILQLRALAMSDRWDDAMSLTMATARTSLRRAG